MEQHPEEPTTPQEETIFDEPEFLLADYNKHVRQARNALYIVAGLMILTGLFSSLKADQEMLLYIWIEVLIMAVIFLVLGLWTEKKPYTAILTGLIVFIAYQVLYIIINPLNIVSGIIVKIVIIVYLIKGLNNAREAQTLKEAFRNDK